MVGIRKATLFYSCVKSEKDGKVRGGDRGRGNLHNAVLISRGEGGDSFPTGTENRVLFYLKGYGRLVYRLR